MGGGENVSKWGVIVLALIDPVNASVPICRGHCGCAHGSCTPLGAYMQGGTVRALIDPLNQWVPKCGGD